MYSILKKLLTLACVLSLGVVMMTNASQKKATIKKLQEKYDTTVLELCNLETKCSKLSQQIKVIGKQLEWAKTGGYEEDKNKYMVELRNLKRALDRAEKRIGPCKKQQKDLSTEIMKIRGTFCRRKLLKQEKKQPTVAYEKDPFRKNKKHQTRVKKNQAWVKKNKEWREEEKESYEENQEDANAYLKRREQLLDQIGKIDKKEVKQLRIQIQEEKFPEPSVNDLVETKKSPFQTNQENKTSTPNQEITPKQENKTSATKQEITTKQENVTKKEALNPELLRTETESFQTKQEITPKQETVAKEKEPIVVSSSFFTLMLKGACAALGVLGVFIGATYLLGYRPHEHVATWTALMGERLPVFKAAAHEKMAVLIHKALLSWNTLTAQNYPWSSLVQSGNNSLAYQANHTCVITQKN